MKYKVGQWLINKSSESAFSNTYIFLADFKVKDNGLPYFDIVKFEGGGAEFIKEWGIPKQHQHWWVYHPTDEDRKTAVKAIFGDNR
jgi:hypothetical protein